MSWTAPHVFATFDVLGAAQMNDIGNNLQFLRNGVGGVQRVTSNVGPTSGTVETTLATVVESLDGSTQVEVLFTCYNINGTVAGDLFLVRLYDGATQIAQWVNQPSSTGVFGSAVARTVVTPSAGSHTYTAKLVRSSGTGTATLSAGGGNPATLSVVQAT